MLDMGLPPYDADAALRMGDNSRAAEIEHVAKELSDAKIAYLKMAIQGEICQRLKVLHVAFVSGMSDAEFRVLWGYLMHGNRDGKNITLGQKRLGLLIDKSERAVRRATKDLEETGWLDVEKHQRQDASRSAAIPKRMMNAILFEIVERSNVSGQRIEVPQLTAPQNLDRTNLIDRTEPAGQEAALTGQKASFRPDENVNITIIDNHSVLLLEPARENPLALVEEDYVEFHKLFRSWGRKPGQHFEGMGGISREFSDKQLDGSLRALPAKVPQEIRVEAARITILDMQARNFFDDGRNGPRGFANYFQQELRGQANLLLKPPAAQERSLAPPGHKHWRDEQREKSKMITELVNKSTAGKR